MIVVQYTITRHGVPIGEVELAFGSELAAGRVRPLAAYDAVRVDVQLSTFALGTLGFLAPADWQRRSAVAPAPGEAVDLTRALGRGARLGHELALRDRGGASVAVDWIELLDFGGSPPDVVALLGTRGALNGVPAALAPRLRAAADSSRPEA
jgi:hypothetical protein